MFEILKETCKRYLLAVGVCCCLQICNIHVSDGVVLGPSLKVVSITGVLLYYAKVSPLYNVL